MWPQAKRKKVVYYISIVIVLAVSNLVYFFVDAGLAETGALQRPASWQIGLLNLGSRSQICGAVNTPAKRNSLHPWAYPRSC